MNSDLQKISVLVFMQNTVLLLPENYLYQTFSCQNLLSDLAALKIVHVRSRQIFVSPFRTFVLTFIMDLVQNPLMSRRLFQWPLDQILKGSIKL